MVIKSREFNVGDKVCVETREGKKNAIVVERCEQNRLIVEILDKSKTNDQPGDLARLVTYARFLTPARQQLIVQWTAISYNWSTGKTAAYPFKGHEQPEFASKQFSDNHPGEELLALIHGDIATDITTYPLTYLGDK